MGVLIFCGFDQNWGDQGLNFDDFEGLDCWVFMGFGFCKVGVGSKYCEIRNPSWNKKISGRRCEIALPCDFFFVEKRCQESRCQES